MTYSTYRDGGTKVFIDSYYEKYFDGESSEICLNCRYRGDGEWYVGHPDKGRKLTPKEKEDLLPHLLGQVERDVKWRVHYLEDLKRYV